MKRRHIKVRLSEEQQLILGLLLVILLAISMLYCLGFASILLRETWQNAPLPWSGTGPPAETTDQPLTPMIEATDPAPVPR